MVCSIAFSLTAQQNSSMVRINGGTFQMGSPSGEQGRNDDEVQHLVTVGSFTMGIYEVTQKEYQEIMGTNPSSFSDINDRPVENVSWYNAIEYCNRRSEIEGLLPAYTINGTGNKRTVTWNQNANGYRLPTEAEWEYACRAGTATAYNTGASISDNTGWYEENSDKTTHSAGQKDPNAWGLYDMHGNVWEWCWDWYGDNYYNYYRNNPPTDPPGASSGSGRVFRGGSWSNSALIVRSAYRGFTYPYYRFNSIGFRLVRNTQ